MIYVMSIPRKYSRKPINFFLMFNLYAAKGYQIKFTVLLLILVVFFHLRESYGYSDFLSIIPKTCLFSQLKKLCSFFYLSKFI